MRKFNYHQALIFFVFILLTININGAQDKIEDLILGVDLNRIRLLYDSDILLRAEDKERYIKLAIDNKNRLKANLEKFNFDKKDRVKIIYGLLGFYGFSKALKWLSFLKKRSMSATELHTQNEYFSALNIKPYREEEEYEIEITTVYKYLTYSASILLGCFSGKQIYEALTRKARTKQYKKSITILAILNRLVVRKDLDNEKK